MLISYLSLYLVCETSYSELLSDVLVRHMEFECVFLTYIDIQVDKMVREYSRLNLNLAKETRILLCSYKRVFAALQ